MRSQGEDHPPDINWAGLKKNLYLSLLYTMLGKGRCYDTHVEVRGQLCRVSSLLPPLRGFYGSNAGHRDCTASLLSSSEPSQQPQARVLYQDPNCAGPMIWNHQPRTERNKHSLCSRVTSHPMPWKVRLAAVLSDVLLQLQGMKSRA